MEIGETTRVLRVRQIKNEKKRKTRFVVIIFLNVTVFLVIIIMSCYFALLIKMSPAIPVVKNEFPKPTLLITLDPGLVIADTMPSDLTEDYYDPAPSSYDTPQLPIYYVQPFQEEIINILVLGSDSRTGDPNNGRCDTIMLLSFDTTNNRATITSFLRDIWVPIEGFGYNRVNATYAWGGIGLTINTINALFSLDIQKYIIVDFNGMENLIDEFGGLDLNITSKEADYYNQCGWDIQPGMNHLDGEQTLLHARNRKSGGGDFERTRRQRDIMLALYKKIADIQDLHSISSLLTYFMNHVETNIDANLLYSLAVACITSDEFNVNQCRIPVDGTWKYATIGGRSVIVIEFDKNSKFLYTFLYGE